MTTKGRCLCGNINVRINGPLAPIEICHCSQCRRAQGTAFAANIPVSESQFELESGADSLSTYESSPGKERAFCGRCGSPVFSRKNSLPGVLRIRVGLLEGPIQARPVSHAFTASKADWWNINDDLPQFTGPRQQAND